MVGEDSRALVETEIANVSVLCGEEVALRSVNRW